MTTNKLLERAAALVPGASAGESDLRMLCGSWLEILCEECRACENSLRAAEGLPDFPAGGIPADFDAEAGFRPVLMRTVLPYGLAAFIAQEEDNLFLSGHMRLRFLAALSEAARPAEHSIEAGGENFAEIY